MRKSFGRDFSGGIWKMISLRENRIKTIIKLLEKVAMIIYERGEL
jgi:hypothetical protein